AGVPGPAGRTGGGPARLSVGVAMSDVILPEHIGRPAMVATVADGVRRAMAEAGIDDPAEVHYVQTQPPPPTRATTGGAGGRGEDPVTDEPLESMNLSNGTTALGIAVALGEIESPAAEAIGRDLALFSSVASCSSGVELDRAQIVVVGNAPGVGGRFRVDHLVMRDALDVDGIYGAIRSAGLDLTHRPVASDLGPPPPPWPPASGTGSSMCSSSARPIPPGGCGTGARWRWTTPTSTTTATSRVRWEGWRRRRSATRRSSCRWPPCTRGRRAAARWRLSSTSATPERPTHCATAEWPYHPVLGRTDASSPGGSPRGPRHRRDGRGPRRRERPAARPDRRAPLPGEGPRRR